ncbi:PbsX family transcriptional regulator [Pseudaminobacter sp. 19-2017]|uniref:PbsX family transcriptional regulator n=1 Tax=Pseudaminobacter soli (ex Zhang et al. 2022) TaxID=2831468 RepID=A0A942E2K8_9HYPH|nr:AbrB/MazE/SpoVT family DNA-binding domain-containing protein [Pseudaminobacter soli]MBS3649885.1 PbsX family transcriptional regulator [Pseudaminobacter soli]
MTVTSKIRRQGGAAVITIPPALLKMMNLDVGGQVSLTVTEGELVARPISSVRRRYSLEELLQGAEALSELNAETAWAREGEPVGREIS